MAVPLSSSEERRRCELASFRLFKIFGRFLIVNTISNVRRRFSNSLFRDAGHRGYSYILFGIGNRPEIEKRRYRSMESSE